MSKKRQQYKAMKKKQRRKKIALWILTPILVLLIGATTYATYLHNKAGQMMEEAYQPIDRKKDNDKAEEKTNPKVDNTSILFIGVDDSNVRGFNSGARSDALMVATFNQQSKSIKLLSIPRDSYVYIPEVGKKDKITHAHAYGGVEATIETVEELLQIPIDYYVKMNFNAFVDVVDALGGIEFDVPFDLSEMDSNDRKNAIQLKAGLQTLNGEETLALARTRKRDSDIERGKRQQEIMKAIIKKGLSIGAITKYDDVMEAVGNNMATDLTFKDVKSFFDYATAGTSLDIENLTLSGKNSYIGSVYYYQLDEDELNLTRQILKSHLGTLTTTDDTSKEKSNG